MEYLLTIPGTLNNLNDYITAERTNRHKGARMKASNESIVVAAVWQCMRGIRIDSRAKIINFDKGATYEVYLNGILSENISSPEYTLTDTGTTVVSVVPVVDKMSGFSPRAHVSAPDRYSIHIPATAITPRRPPRHLIPYPELASRYIELAARHNTHR